MATPVDYRHLLSIVGDVSVCAGTGGARAGLSGAGLRLYREYANTLGDSIAVAKLQPSGRMRPNIHPGRVPSTTW